jgi:predicted amidohydrolase YtcJ
MEDAYDILAELDHSGELTLRMFTSVRWGQAGDKTPADRFLEIEKKYTSDLVKPASIKLMADGVPEAHTAFMLNDYQDTPGNRGKPLTDPEDLKFMILDAERKNVSVHIHAIGDGAVRLTLDAIEEARDAVPGEGKRHAIGHMDYVNPEDVPRFKELNVVPQTSIQWATVDPSYDTFVKYVGSKIHDGAYPIRDILDAGGRQTFGTDWPAAAYLSTYKPLIQLETAVTRRLTGVTDGPERGNGQNISVMEAVEALTINVAYQVHAEDYLGSIEVGKTADLIVLGANIFEIPSHKIHETSVDMTVVNGKVVHEN